MSFPEKKLWMHEDGFLINRKSGLGMSLKPPLFYGWEPYVLNVAIST